jgi:prevent-host-death family protein
MQVSVSDAKAQLTDLVRRAEAGDEIILTRHGQPIVTLTPFKTAPRTITETDLHWLKANRITPKRGFETPSESLQALRDGAK